MPIATKLIEYGRIVVVARFNMLFGHYTTKTEKIAVCVLRNNKKFWEELIA
jgi:hypothetical protein